MPSLAPARASLPTSDQTQRSPESPQDRYDIPSCGQDARSWSGRFVVARAWRRFGCDVQTSVGGRALVSRCVCLLIELVGEPRALECGTTTLLQAIGGYFKCLWLQGWPPSAATSSCWRRAVHIRPQSRLVFAGRGFPASLAQTCPAPLRVREDLRPKTSPCARIPPDRCATNSVESGVRSSSAAPWRARRRGARKRQRRHPHPQAHEWSSSPPHRETCRAQVHLMMQAQIGLQVASPMEV